MNKSHSFGFFHVRKGIMKNIGNNLRMARRQKGLTLKQLESLTGIKFQTLSKYEKEIETPTAANIQKLEDALGIRLTEFSNEDEEIIRFFQDFLNHLYSGISNQKYYSDNKDSIKKRCSKSLKLYLLDLADYICSVYNNEYTNSAKLESKLERLFELEPEYNTVFLDHKGYRLYKRGEYKEAEECFMKASSICKDERARALIYFHESYVLTEEYRIFDAKKRLDRAIEIFTMCGYIKRVFFCKMCLANLYYQNFHHREAINQYLSCIQIATDAQFDPKYAAMCYRNIAWIYIVNHRYEDSMEYLKKASANESNHPLQVLYEIYCLYRLNDIQGAKKKISENKNIITTVEYRKLLDLFRMMVNQYRKQPEQKLIDIAIEVYEMYLQELDYDLASFYADIVIELLEQKNDFERANYYLKEKNNCTYFSRIHL